MSAGVFREFERASIERSIPACFEQQVRQRPAAIAVRTPAVSLTYDQLNRKANRLSARLGTVLGQGEEPVALFFEQGVEAVIAILAVLKAGKFYLPLDPAESPVHLAARLEHAGARLVLTPAAFVNRVRDWAGAHRFTLAADAEVEGDLDTDPGLPPGPDHLACLFYTSGSTGQPKGVMDRHRNVLHNVMRYTNNLRITPGDRLSLIQSPAFSGTVSSLFSALLNGATVCPFPVRERGVGALGPWLEQMEITIYHSVPAIFRGFVSDRWRLPRLRVIRLEGDQVLPSDVDLFRQHFGPDSVLAVGLGATETGLSCQHLIRPGDPPEPGPVPIGRPTCDVDILILDAEGREQGPGRTGEIVVRSRYLAAGYWRDAARTEQAFRPAPDDPEVRWYRTGDLGRRREDGVVEFLGRRDAQPKVRGRHVEVAEVEAALSRVRGLRQAVAMVREDRPGEPRLVAYVVPDAGGTPSIRTLRETLARDLPEGMVPTAYVFLKALPLTRHEKVDRRALPAPGPADRDVGHVRIPPRDAVELAVVQVWEEVLEQTPIGVTDDFFDLGGDSLRAGRVCARLGEVLGRAVPLASLMAQPTVEAMASALRDPGGEHRTEWLVPLQRHGDGTPLVLVHDHHGSALNYLALVRRLGPDQPCHGLHAAWTTAALARVESLESLASTYAEHLLEWQPRGPYRLAGSCFGAVLAFEMARQLLARGQRIDLLALFQVTPLDFPRLVSPVALRLFRLHRERHRLGANVRYHWLRLKALEHGARWEYLRTRIPSVGPGVRRFATALRGHAPARVQRPEPAIAAPLRRLFEKYQARPFPGPVTLCLSRPDTRLYSVRAAEDWSGLSTAGIDVRWCDVTSSDMLREPHVQLLADQLRAALAGEPRTT